MINKSSPTVNNIEGSVQLEPTELMKRYWTYLDMCIAGFTPLPPRREVLSGPRHPI